MRRAAPGAVRRLHGLDRFPVRDGGELRDVAPHPPELLHVEAARLLLDLEDAVLVVVAEVLVHQLLAGPPEPGPRYERLPPRSRHQDLMLAGGVSLQVHPHLPSPSSTFQGYGIGTRFLNPFRDATPWSGRARVP